MKKLINQDILEGTTSNVIEILMANKCTLSDFREVSDKVHRFYQDNATVNVVSSIRKNTEQSYHHSQLSNTNDRDHQQ